MQTWDDINEQLRRLETLNASLDDGALSMLACPKCGLRHRLLSWSRVPVDECPQQEPRHVDGQFVIVGESDGVLHATYEVWITDLESHEDLIGTIGRYVTVYSRTVRSTALDRYNTQGFGAVQRARREALRWLRGEPEEPLRKSIECDTKAMIDGLHHRPIL